MLDLFPLGFPWLFVLVLWSFLTYELCSTLCTCVVRLEQNIMINCALLSGWPVICIGFVSSLEILHGHSLRHEVFWFTLNTKWNKKTIIFSTWPKLWNSCELCWDPFVYPNPAFTLSTCVVGLEHDRIITGALLSGWPAIWRGLVICLRIRHGRSFRLEVFLVSFRI